MIQNELALIKNPVMLSVNGIFDGKSVKITDKLTEKKKYKVVITFIEEIQQDDYDIHNISSQSKGLDFLEDPAEDIYQDYLNPKSKGK
jgi:hypothetical protein